MINQNKSKEDLKALMSDVTNILGMCPLVVACDLPIGDKILRCYAYKDAGCERCQNEWIEENYERICENE